MPPKMWTEVIRPALSDKKFMIAIGTPAGHNAFSTYIIMDCMMITGLLLNLKRVRRRSSKKKN